MESAVSPASVRRQRSTSRLRKKSFDSGASTSKTSWPEGSDSAASARGGEKSGAVQSGCRDWVAASMVRTESVAGVAVTSWRDGGRR